MIKRLVFDLDNTLLPWKEEYYNEIKSALNALKIKYTENDYNKILEAFDEYENNYYIFNRKLMIDFINKYTGKNYPERLIYEITDRYAKCAPNKLEGNIIKTLEYLQSKYEMVILTDWYGEQQLARLEVANIAKYFEKVYSAEKTKRKPFKEAFMQAIGNNKPEECVMIGDNIQRDIKGALNAGLQAIWYNQKQKLGKPNCPIIKKFEELNNIL